MSLTPKMKEYVENTYMQGVDMNDRCAVFSALVTGCRKEITKSKKISYSYYETLETAVDVCKDKHGENWDELRNKIKKTRKFMDGFVDGELQNYLQILDIAINDTTQFKIIIKRYVTFISDLNKMIKEKKGDGWDKLRDKIDEFYEISAENGINTSDKFHAILNTCIKMTEDEGKVHRALNNGVEFIEEALDECVVLKETDNGLAKIDNNFDELRIKIAKYKKLCKKIKDNL